MSPTSLPIVRRTSALTGSLCVPSPRAMNEPRNGCPSTRRHGLGAARRPGWMCAYHRQHGWTVVRPTLGRQPVEGQLRGGRAGRGAVTSPVGVRGAEVLADDVAYLSAHVPDENPQEEEITTGTAG